MDNLYNTLADLCAARGITGYRLCKDIGIQPSIMTDLKSGRKKGLSAETADKIATYFNVSVSYLLGKEKEKLPATPQGIDEQLDGIDFALLGKVKDLSDAQKRDVLKFVEFLESKDK